MKTVTTMVWRVRIYFLGASFAVGVLLFTAASAQANTTPSVTLTVNNGASAAIVNGQPVNLDWYAVGVTNCVINNGVGPIPDSELPSGSRTVIPPNNLQTVYTMSCDGGSDSSTVSLVPEVTLTSPDGNSVSPDPLTGDYALTLEWSSVYATECSNITWQRQSGGTGAASNAQSGFPDQYKTSGQLVFDGYPNYPIDETTTYEITCTNVVTGLSTTASFEVVVLNPPAAPDPVVTLDTNNQIYTIDASPTLGFGYVNLKISSQNVSSCTYTAYNLSGSSLTVNGHTNRWGGGGFNEVYSAEMSTSTKFNVSCSRSTDGKVATSSVTVYLNPLAGALPSPTLSFTTNPASGQLDPLTGKITVNYDYAATAVNSCPVRSAIKPDGSESDFNNWGGNTNKSGTYQISITTTFVVGCKRNYDNAWVWATTTVTALQSASPLPAPTVTVWVTDRNLQPVASMPLTNGNAAIKVFWESTDATFCDVRLATTANASYTFAYSNATDGFVYHDVATTTTFRVECGRGGDSLRGVGEATLEVTSGAGVLSDAASVDAGECIDGTGGSIDIPPGYMANPTDGTCMVIPPPSTVDLDVNISGQDIDEAVDDVVTIAAGDTINLNWTSTDAYECLSSSGQGFNVAGLTSGTDAVTEPTLGNAITYTIQCRGYGGDSSDAIEIRRPALAVEVTVTKNTVNPGETVDVGWNLNGNDPAACVLTGPGLPGANSDGEVLLSAPTGSLTGISINGESNFSVSCDANMIVNGIPVNPADAATQTVRIVSQSFDS